MKKLLGLSFPLITAVLTFSTPIQGQDANDLLGAAGGFALAKQYLDVTPATVDSYRPDLFSSSAVGYRKLRVDYQGPGAAECRLAAALTVFAAAMQEDGEYDATVNCPDHRIRVTVDGQTGYWQVIQYGRSTGRVVFRKTHFPE